VLLVVGATRRELEAVPADAALVCGIGPVEAAAATARALAERRPDAVLHVGIAGSRTLEAPAVVLGSEAVYCDLADASARIPRVERVAPDAALLERARRALPDAHVLPIGTCARVGGGVDHEVEAMEGFGVLRAAQLARVPALELRAVSNHPDEADRDRWRFDDAFAALDEAVATLVRALEPAAAR
jgi:futalosine hydrolase